MWIRACPCFPEIRGHQQARDRSEVLEVSFLHLLLPRRSPRQEYRFLYKLQLIFFETLTSRRSYPKATSELRKEKFFIDGNQRVLNCRSTTYLHKKTSLYTPGPYLGFFVCGGKLGFREISDQYSYKKQPSKIRHYVRKKTFSFPGGGNCPLRPPAMYGPARKSSV